MANSELELSVTIHLTAYYLIPIEGDGRFALIHGYESSESNFHYSQFSGFDLEGRPCWVLSFSELPPDAVIIPYESGEDMVRRWHGGRL
jgi:hypothetical protein